MIPSETHLPGSRTKSTKRRSRAKEDFGAERATSADQSTVETFAPSSSDLELAKAELAALDCGILSSLAGWIAPPQKHLEEEDRTAESLVPKAKPPVQFLAIRERDWIETGILRNKLEALPQPGISRPFRPGSHDCIIAPATPYPGSGIVPYTREEQSTIHLFQIVFAAASIMSLLVVPVILFAFKANNELIPLAALGAGPVLTVVLIRHLTQIIVASRSSRRCTSNPENDEDRGENASLLKSLCYSIFH